MNTPKQADILAAVDAIEVDEARCADREALAWALMFMATRVLSMQYPRNAGTAGDMTLSDAGRRKLMSMMVFAANSATPESERAEVQEQMDSDRRLPYLGALLEEPEKTWVTLREQGISDAGATMCLVVNAMSCAGRVGMTDQQRVGILTSAMEAVLAEAETPA